MSEDDLMRLFMLRAPLAIPDLWIERRNILNIQTVQGFRAKNGIKGQADVFAIAAGVHVELEMKAARGTLAERQKAWRAACARRKIPHLVLRAKPREQPDATVARWISELAAVLNERAA